MNPISVAPRSPEQATIATEQNDRSFASFDDDEDFGQESGEAIALQNLPPLAIPNPGGDSANQQSLPLAPMMPPPMRIPAVTEQGQSGGSSSEEEKAVAGSGSGEEYERSNSSMGYNGRPMSAKSAKSESSIGSYGVGDSQTSVGANEPRPSSRGNGPTGVRDLLGKYQNKGGRSGGFDSVHGRNYNSGSSSSGLSLSNRRSSGAGVGSDSDTMVLKRPVEIRENRQQKISELKNRIKSKNVGKYLEEFQEAVEPTKLIVGKVSVEEIEEQERRMEEERQRIAEQETYEFKERQQQIEKQEQLARERLQKHLKVEKEKYQKDYLSQVTLDRNRAKEMHETFERTEDQLKARLGERRGEVVEKFGEVTYDERSGMYNAKKKYHVEWRDTPQPVQMRVEMIRAAKDKVLPGRYVVLVSLFDRLGGQSMRWSTLKGHEWYGATKAVKHSGQFDDLEMRFDQNMYTVCPSRKDMRPSMVFMFEVFLLKGKASPIDQVVAWGAFPVSDPKFDVIKGKFKVPLIRGEIDLAVDTHKAYEKAYGENLDNWLANLYFEVIHLPRYQGGQMEYEVMLNYSSALLGHPDRAGEGEYSGASMIAPGADGGEFSLEEIEDAQGKDSKDSGEGVGLGDLSETKPPSDEQMTGFFDKEEVGATDEKTALLGKGQSARSKMIRGQKMAALREKLKFGLKGNNSDELKEQNSQLSFILHQGTSLEFSATNEAYQVQKKYEERQKQKRLRAAHQTAAQLLERYRFCVPQPKGALERREAAKKLEYIKRELLLEFGPTRWRTPDFWLTILMLLVVFWLRLFTHYFGQWCFLYLFNVNISEFTVYPYTIVIHYLYEVVPTYIEICSILAGPLFNLLIFFVFIGLALGLQAVAGGIPDTLSRFFLCFGIGVLMDPLLIFIVDLSTSNWNGDAFKLYNHFLLHEDSGAVGVFLILVIYFAVFCICSIVFYNYILSVHMNGRMLDVYYRLNMDESRFFVPLDMEISMSHLRTIFERAERWRGERGTRRRTVIQHFEFAVEAEEIKITFKDPSKERENEANEDGKSKAEKKKKRGKNKKKHKKKQGNKDDEDSGVEYMWINGRRFRKETSVHMVVWNVELNGSRTIFRQFLRLPEGAVIELTGDTETLGSVEYKILSRTLQANSDITSIESFLAGRNTLGEELDLQAEDAQIDTVSATAVIKKPEEDDVVIVNDEQVGVITQEELVEIEEEVKDVVA